VHLDIGHARFEVLVSDEHGVGTLVSVKDVSARIGSKSREDYMDERLAAYDATGNVNIGYEVRARHTAHH
jgi:hypothetical protein